MIKLYPEFEERIGESREILEKLLAAPVLRFDSSLRGRLPEEHGIYRIFELGADPATSLRAGRTKRAAEGLRQRIYQNHLMGGQEGNIRAQLVRAGRCIDLETAKDFLREKCGVQFVVIREDDRRKWAEHFMLAILHPIESD